MYKAIENSLGSKYALSVLNGYDKDLIVDRNTNTGTITIKTRNNKISVFLTGFDSISSMPKAPASKIYTYIMQLVNSTKTNTLEIKHKELVSLGIYSSVRTSRNGVFKVLERLLNLSISIRDHNKRSGLNMITGYKSMSGGFRVEVNNDYIDLWKTFTFFPQWAYELQNKSFNIMQYITFIARNNLSKISREEPIIIKISTLCDYIGLNLEDTEKMTRDVINPIKRSLEEIKNTAINKDIYIELLVDNNSISSFLNGKLSVQISGELMQIFSNQSNKIQDKKDENRHSNGSKSEQLGKKKDIVGEEKGHNRGKTEEKPNPIPSDNTSHEDELPNFN